MIEDNTGKWDELTTDYALEYVTLLARTLSGVATIVSYEITEYGDYDTLTWFGYVSDGYGEPHRFEVANTPQEESW